MKPVPASIDLQRNVEIPARDQFEFLTHLHPSVDLSSLIRDIKTSITAWIKAHNIFENFPGWQEGYGAFTKSHADRDATIEYIKDQEAHHKHESFLDELKRLLKEEGVNFDEKYLE